MSIPLESAPFDGQLAANTGPATLGRRSEEVHDPEAAAPGQLQIGASAMASGHKHGMSETNSAPSGTQEADLTSGPHLRAVVLVLFLLLWVVVRDWASQLTILPVTFVCTMSTSAMWCMPHELVVSLGPVPVCFFRRRIPYKDIASVQIVTGRLRILSILACRGIRFWRPLGFVYGLTFGKALVDIELKGEAANGSSQAAKGSALIRQPLLVSVDDACDVIEYVKFRQEHGPHVPVPEMLLASPHKAPQVRWVVCDLLDLLFRWHARNQTTCDIFGILLQPFQGDAWGSHARIA